MFEILHGSNDSASISVYLIVLVAEKLFRPHDGATDDKAADY
jgi:hypothetical protein